MKMSLKDQWLTSFLYRWVVSVRQLIIFDFLVRRNTNVLRRFHFSIGNRKPPSRKMRFTIGHSIRALKRILDEGSKIRTQKAIQDRELLQQFYQDLSNNGLRNDEESRYLNSALAISLQEDIVAWTFLKHLKIRLQNDQIQLLAQHRRLSVIILKYLEFCGCNFALSDYGEIKSMLPVFLTKIESVSLLELEQPQEDLRFKQNESSPNLGLVSFVGRISETIGLRVEKLELPSGLKKAQNDMEKTLNYRANTAGNKAFLNTLVYQAHLQSLSFMLDSIDGYTKRGVDSVEIDVEACLSEAISQLDKNRQKALK